MGNRLFRTMLSSPQHEPTTPSASALSPDGPSTPRFPRGEHLPVLDAVRGMAVLLVLLRHFTANFEPQTGFGEFLRDVARTGWNGVDLFFVLSGFLITGILIDTRDRPHYYRNFFVRRALRIFPLYYGVLLVLFVLIPVGASVLGASDLLARSADYALMREHQAWYWLYLTNVLAVVKGWEVMGLNTTHLWSLAVEEQFYLLWPFVVARCRTPWQVARVGLWMLVIGAGFRASVLADGGSDAAAYTLMPARLDALGAGAIVAALARDRGAWSSMVRAAPAVFWVSSALILATFVHRGGLEHHDSAVQVSGHTRLAIGFAAMLVLVVAYPRGLVGRLVDLPGMRWLGQYSYGIYIFHFPLQFLIEKVFPPSVLPAVLGTRIPTHALYLLLLTGVSALLAWASWHLYEKHFLRLKDRFGSGPTAGATAHRAPTPDRGAGGFEGVPPRPTDRALPPRTAMGGA
jgi:peptidoglycan/LPS O-acetylase OafA/YrhL